MFLNKKLFSFSKSPVRNRTSSDVIPLPSTVRAPGKGGKRGGGGGAVAYCMTL